MLRAVLLMQLPGCAAVATLLGTYHGEERTRAGELLLLRAQAAAAAAGERRAGVERALQALGAALPAQADGLPAFRNEALQVEQVLAVDGIVLSTATGEPLLDTRTGRRAPLQPLLEASGHAGVPVGRSLDPGPPPTEVRIGVGQAGAAHVLAAVLAPERLQQALEATELPAGWGSMLVDERGVLLARAPGAPGRVEFMHPALRVAIAGRPQGVLEVEDRDGRSVLAAHARSPGTGWTAIVIQPSREVAMRVWRSAGLAAAAGLALLLPVGWLLARTSRAFTHPAAEPLSGGPAAAPNPSPEQLRPGSEFPKALFDEAVAHQADIARELHDGVGSGLAGVTMLLGTALSFTREPEAAALIARSHDLVTRATQQIRAISRGIMPAGQERGGLLPALHHFATDMSAVRGVACTVRSRGDFGEITAETGGHVFRIVQEATSNALRHGHATRVRITLARAGARCRLVIADNGTGCDVGALSAAQAGLGVRSMRARAEATGGVLEFRRPASGGLRLRITWGHCPRPPAAAPAAA